MKIQIYMKNEPLEDCDVLIAKEGASVNVPITQLMKLAEQPPKVMGVKDTENMMLKAAILVSQAIFDGITTAQTTPVQIVCPDKATMDAICSVEYRSAVGNTVKCIAAGTRPASASKPKSKPRVNNLAKPKTENANTNANAVSANKETEQKQPKDEPVQPAPVDSNSAVLPDTEDPDLVKDGEVNLEDNTTEQPEPKNNTDVNAMKAMAILKEAGVPSSQIPGSIDAVREAADPYVTLPMQVRLKLAKDGALDDMDPEETAKLIKPIFDKLKKIIAEIDAGK